MSTNPPRVGVRSVMERLRRFPGSANYWEKRYQDGGNSGAGSYGDIARFKAEYLNRFVLEHEVSSVVEFGCGDGAQLSRAEYPRYVGLDVARSAVEHCSGRFAGDTSKSFIFYDPAFFHNNGAIKGDLAVSLDVVLHLVEDTVLETYLSHLFGAAERFVIFFTENTDRRDGAKHVRFRTLASWAHLIPAGWEMVGRFENPLKELDNTLADFVLFESLR
jgi:hypothetical protein